MSPNRTVTAVELAQQIRWDDKRLRGWLRAAWRAGHPLLSSHTLNEPWVFTADEADQLRKAALRGPWGANDISPGTRQTVAHSAVPPTATRSAFPPTASRSIPSRTRSRPESVIRTTLSAPRVAAALVTGQPISAGDLRRASLPAGPGLYAWWHKPDLLPGVVHRVSGPTLTDDGTLELAYVGIASSLHKRVLRSHLGSSTGSSTLRRALGAWLGEDQGWVTEWRSERVQHDAMSERALTTWMEQNLNVTWVEHASPGAVEADVISILDSPLNHQHNQSHPNWRALDAARRACRDGGS